MIRITTDIGRIALAESKNFLRMIFLPKRFHLLPVSFLSPSLPYLKPNFNRMSKHHPKIIFDQSLSWISSIFIEIVRCIFDNMTREVYIVLVFCYNKVNICINILMIYDSL